MERIPPNPVFEAWLVCGIWKDEAVLGGIEPPASERQSEVLAVDTIGPKRWR